MVVFLHIVERGSHQKSFTNHGPVKRTILEDPLIYILPVLHPSKIVKNCPKKPTFRPGSDQRFSPGIIPVPQASLMGECA